MGQVLAKLFAVQKIALRTTLTALLTRDNVLHHTLT